jgi:uncharacterized RDD family membrane protein YckC
MSGQNPYQAPQADISLDPSDRQAEELPDAGLGARFLNLLIDTFLSRIVATIFAVAVVRVFGPGDAAAVLSVVLVLGGMFGYYVLCEGAFGWTVGKLITGTRVIRIDGRKPNVPQILGRTFARFIPFEPFSVLFGRSNSGWHDSLSGTRVVKVRR